MNLGSVIMPAGYCPGVDCGPYTCNEPSADQKATQDISKRENSASASKPSSPSA